MHASGVIPRPGLADRCQRTRLSVRPCMRPHYVQCADSCCVWDWHRDEDLGFSARRLTPEPGIENLTQPGRVSTPGASTVSGHNRTYTVVRQCVRPYHLGLTCPEGVEASAGGENRAPVSAFRFRPHFKKCR